MFGGWYLFWLYFKFTLLKYWSSASSGYDIDTELIWIKITALGFLDDLHSSG